MAAFKPVLGSAPKLLILGSMPGRVSLSAQQYYAHPRNSFWWIMSQLFEFELSLEYVHRSRLLSERGVALWDVLYDCERPGSLDSNIVRETEVVNDFDWLFRKHASISMVGFNGATAENLFNRHCSDMLQRYPEIMWIKLPSTSPAHASLKREQKLDIWRSSLMPLV